MIKNWLRFRWPSSLKIVDYRRLPCILERASKAIGGKRTGAGSRR